MSRDDGSPLGRWSRRTAAARREAESPAPRPEAPPEAAAEQAAPAPEPEKTDAELLEELGLPDPDTLGRGDDFSAFMSRAVPARLRRRALRRLWGSDPKLAALDGLVDYDDDYRAMAAAGGAVTTSYEVGRGFLGRAAKAAERLAGEQDAAAAAPAPEAATPAPEAGTEPETGPETRLETGQDAPAEAGEDETPKADPPPTPRPRRMTFAFDEAPAEPQAAGAERPSPSAARKSS